MDVIVVGGGAIGLAVAWRAAVAGLQVAVVDPKPGRGASYASAGMLAPVGEATYGEQALLDLNLASWRLYPKFIAELEEAAGGSTGYRRSGMLLVARDADENAALERDYRFRQGLGLSVQRLTSSECRQLEPGLAPSIRGGMIANGDAQVDPRRLLGAMMRACARAGVEFVCRRASVHVARDRVGGVRLEDGRGVAANTVVLAAGCWSALVEGLPDDAIPPVRPVKGQTLRLIGPRTPEIVSRMVRGADVYIVPRADGRLLVGATMEERGFDTTATAGGVYQLLRDARELIPDIAELELSAVGVGLRPGTPDNAPLIGESTLPGLLVATGHYRNGILLTPITGVAIASLLTGAAPPAEVAPFSPARFARVPQEVA